VKLHHLVLWVAVVASMAACSGGGGHPSAHSTRGAQAAAVVGPVAPGEATGAGVATAATPPAGATNATAPTTSSPPAPAAANGTAPGIVSSRPGVVPPPPPGQNWAPATQSPPAVPVRADVDSPCVTPGGQQGLTIHTAPNDHVSFSTEYADHTNENIPSKQYQEGFGPGQADGTGVFRVTWHVPANAAAGRATIHFIAQSTSSATTFTVASDAAPVSSSHSCG
jgi:hypothetical protein